MEKNKELITRDLKEEMEALAAQRDKELADKQREFEL